MKPTKRYINLSLLALTGLLLLSSCQADDSPEIIEATPVASGDLIQESETQESQTETETTSNFRSNPPTLSSKSILDEDDYMTINTTYAYIEVYEDETVMDIINAAIDKQVMEIHNSFYTNLRMSLSQSNGSDPDAPAEDTSPVTISIEGSSIYLDDQILSYRVKGVSDEAYLNEQESYLNYDLSSGQSISLFDLISESDLSNAFEAAYSQIYQTPMSSGIFDYWNVDHAYTFIDVDTIEITAPAYYLSYEQIEPMTLEVDLDHAYDLDLSKALYVISPLSNTEYTEAYNLNYVYPEVVSKDPLALQMNSDIMDRIQTALDYNLDFSNEDYQNMINSDYEWRPYYFNTSYVVHANTEEYVSIGLTFYQYTGGAHGLVTTSYFNYNLKEESPLTLDALFEPDFDYTTYINDIIYRAIDDLGGESAGYVFEGITEDQKFYIEGNWLILTFDPYDIAPYAVGSPEFKIPLPSN